VIGGWFTNIASWGVLSLVLLILWVLLMIAAIWVLSALFPGDGRWTKPCGEDRKSPYLTQRGTSLCRLRSLLHHQREGTQ
jgi:hypothetical protein